MTSPARSRALRAVAATAAVAMAALAVLGGPAAALRREPPLKVGRYQPVDQQYPQIAGQYPGTGVRIPDPDQCNSFTFCDTIPMDVIVPTDMGLGDDYFLDLKVIWDYDGTGADLEVFLYDDGQVKEAKGDVPAGESRYSVLAQDTENNGTAMIKKSEPDLGRFNLVVMNFMGANVDGYRVVADVKVQPFQKPFESLEPPSANPTEEDFDPPVDDSAAPTDFSDPTHFDETPIDDTPLLNDVVPVNDPELDGPLNRRAPGEAAAQTGGALPIVDEAPPTAPSAMVVLFWLAVVPGGLLGALAFWLLRRRKAAFGFA